MAIEENSYIEVNDEVQIYAETARCIDLLKPVLEQLTSTPLRAVVFLAYKEGAAEPIEMHCGGDMLEILKL